MWKFEVVLLKFSPRLVKGLAFKYMYQDLRTWFPFRMRVTIGRVGFNGFHFDL